MSVDKLRKFGDYLWTVLDVFRVVKFHLLTLVSWANDEWTGYKTISPS